MRIRTSNDRFAALSLSEARGVSGGVQLAGLGHLLSVAVLMVGKLLSQASEAGAAMPTRPGGKSEAARNGASL